jgi:hypothetical protein
MPYKIEVPVPNDILTDAALGRFIDVLDKHKQHISSIYLPLGHIDKDIDLWGIRAPDFIYTEQGVPNVPMIGQWESCVKALVEYTQLPVKLLMNNLYSRDIHLPESKAKILAKLRYYKGIFDIKSVTVADFSAIPLIEQVGLPISLSTNSHNSLTDLDMVFEVYGAELFESFVIQRDLNRNPAKLLKFLQRRGLTDKAVLMVNEGCINACPYKQAGDIEIGLSDVKTKANVIHVGGCTALQRTMAWTFLTSPFLTYEMLAQWYPDIKTIKLAGRNLPVSDIKHQLDHYVSGKEVLLEKILNVFPKDTGIKTTDLSIPYQNMVMHCDKECSMCRKCETTYNEVLK